MTDDRTVPRDDGRHRDPAMPEEDASTNLRPAAHSPEDPDRRGTLSDDELVRRVEDRREPVEDDSGVAEEDRDAEFGDATQVTRSWHA